jgi:bifunctional DNA-binding transcriptional regulator/antitoxin component of YhaV-PrlF toxin-antitoxin module
MREESTVAEVDNRGRLQLPIPLRKALKIMDGGLVRVTVNVIEMEESKSSNENPHRALITA